ncbi:hypothetical protein [Silvimonas sp.]|uniref:hypothetical protein n=1 Tax=Silvimonas sp. TaxID=2650811 RepID=UPI00284C4CCF|nr:hypothetical protein [Silvimonas sp.]MDR3429703.1 hypothetical protein [Silvimonas sp.]
MQSRIVCPSVRPANRDSAPPAGSGHPPCPECDFPIRTFKRLEDEADGGKQFRVSCGNCCRWFKVILRIIRDRYPAPHPMTVPVRADAFLGCWYCGGALKTYSGRRASYQSIERFVRCDNLACGHLFVAVYEFIEIEAPEPGLVRTTLRTRPIRYQRREQYSLTLH